MVGGSVYDGQTTGKLVALNLNDYTSMVTQWLIQVSTEIDHMYLMWHGLDFYF